MRKRRRVRRTRPEPPKPAAPPRARSRRQDAAVPLTLGELRVIVCGVTFILLVGLKLVLPGSLSTLRGTLGTWLARDADFVSAFSAVGRSVSGEGGALDALEDAYVAVFGASEAVEVSGAAELPSDDEPSPTQTRDWPEHAVAEQRVLGFDYAAPLAGTVTSPFGWREHPETGREAFHYGVDIAADEGAEIACFADGVVGVVGESVELGKYLTVHHANDALTLYAHCSRITAASGDTVTRGGKLAEVGSTGNATGPHLHFELHIGEDCLDPQYYLS